MTDSDPGVATVAAEAESGFDFDPYDYEGHRDPYPTYKVLRDSFPLYHNEERRMWALTRFDDVLAAAQDWKTFSNTPGVDIDDFPDVLGPGAFIDLDPPRHAELRAVVRGHFTPKAIAALEPRIESIAHELIDRFSGETRVDVARRFAWELPVAVISLIMGLPAADRQLLVDLVHRFVARTSGSTAVPDAARDAAIELEAYFRVALDEHRQTPTDDVLTQLARGIELGRLSADEAVGVCYLLYVAGIDTTASLMSNALNNLAQRSDLAAELRDDPTLLPQAVEEFLRYESPVPQLARSTTRRVEIHGGVIPAGGRVLLVYAAANRDERRFENPDRLDFQREAKRAVAFGNGIHFCLGAALARVEARSGLKAFLERFRAIAPAGRGERTPTHGTYGFWRLPLTLEG